MWFSALSQMGEQSTRTLFITTSAVSVSGTTTTRILRGVKLPVSVRSYSVGASLLLYKLTRKASFTTGAVLVSHKNVSVRASRKLNFTKVSTLADTKNSRVLIGKRLRANTAVFQYKTKDSRVLVGKRLPTNTAVFQSQTKNLSALVFRKLGINAAGVQTQSLNSGVLFGRLLTSISVPIIVQIPQSRILHGRRINASPTTEYSLSSLSVAFRFTRRLKITATSAQIAAVPYRVLRGRFLAPASVQFNCTTSNSFLLAKRKLRLSTHIININTNSLNILSSRKFRYSTSTTTTYLSGYQIRLSRRVQTSFIGAQALISTKSKLLFGRRAQTSVFPISVQSSVVKILRGKKLFTQSAYVSSQFSGQALRATRRLPISRFSLVLTQGGGFRYSW